MAKRDKYRNNKASDFFDYTEGKLSDKERNAFERRMQKDPFESDAAEGFSSVSREEAKQDLHNAEGHIRRRIARAGSRMRRNRRIVWYSAAAAFASLMIVTTVFFRLNDNGLERFETAPEMREAAKEQSAPLEEDDVEQEAPMGKDADGQKTGPKAAMTKKMSEKGIVNEDEIKADAAFPVTAGPDAKKGYDLKEMQIHEEEQAMDLEDNNLAKELPAVAEEEPPEIEEDHAFARKKINEEAAAGRFNETQQRMAASKAATEPKTTYDLQAPLAAKDNVKKKSNMTAATAIKKADPSGSVEYESAAPEKGMADWDSYIAAHEEWRETRLERLKSERGWLNLAGLFWLEEGKNTFGSEPSKTIVFPENFPPNGGSLILSDRTVTLNADPAAAITAGGEQITRAELKSDQQENTTTLETGSFRWFIIRRGDRFGIRLRDLEHPRIGRLDSIPSYPFSKKWVVEAELVKFDSARTIEVPTVIDGFTEQYQAPGELTFEMKGKKHALLPFKSGDGYFLIFGDGTSGLETYGGGRFLYTDKIEKGKVIIDFNRAYNPPCAFSPFATCPLPPPENLLDLRIEAGEKGVHFD